jgi:hypothetical protein
MQTEGALIDLGKGLFGIESTLIFGDDRQKFLTLLIGAALKAEAEGAR